jgi:NAD(P)H-flavin reductase
MTNFGVPANDPILSRPWSAYQPRPVTIVGERSISNEASTVSVEFDTDGALDHEPGQYVQAIVPGMGEAPVAVASPPKEEGPYELLIRDVGSVTQELLSLGVGGEVGIRGPYGEGFDTVGLQESDLLIVATGDGLASLRPMIEIAVEHPDDYGDVTICYWESSPDEMIYEDRLGMWSEAAHVTVRPAVGSATGFDWNGDVMDLEAVVSDVTFDPRRTNALVAGGHGTVTPVLEVLSEKRLPDDHVFVTLEARMRCGVGMCGTCQFDGLSVCRNGPVFDYRTVKPRVETL